MILTKLKDYLSTGKRLCSREEGNALFLILIAVTLFAALSYAVTQSNRSTGGDSGEGALVSASSITQYPAGVRTGVMRMMIRGVVIEELDFMPPTDANFSTAESRTLVFHPNGGGVAYQEPDAAMVVNDDEVWVFNDDVQLPNVGLDAIGDVVAILPNIPIAVCRNINEQLTGVRGMPVVTPGLADFQDGTTPFVIDSIAEDTAATPPYPGTIARPFLCAQDSDGTYNYYHALVEQ